MKVTYTIKIQPVDDVDRRTLPSQFKMLQGQIVLLQESGMLPPGDVRFLITAADAAPPHENDPQRG